MQPHYIYKYLEVNKLNYYDKPMAAYVMNVNKELKNLPVKSTTKTFFTLLEDIN